MQARPAPEAQGLPDFHAVFHGLDVFLLLSPHSSSVHKEYSLVDGEKTCLTASQ